jgi:mannose-1-phosphate guanylyltransferase/mannose-6-phosphate isomerase
MQKANPASGAGGGRNTAPALTLAALVACKEADDPILLVMPADHVIRDKAAFHMAVGAGIAQAQDGAVVTFGIVPDRPETGYGYIRLGSVLEESSVRRLQGFVEKPDIETARHYVASGDFLWNSGIFMLKASSWLKAIGHFRPDILAACDKACQAATLDLDFVRVECEAFRACPSDSIDYAVMEKLPETVIVGYDVRPDSPVFAPTLRKALNESGADVATSGELLVAIVRRIHKEYGGFPHLEQQPRLRRSP